jgi:hypothetical protein
MKRLVRAAEVGGEDFEPDFREFARSVLEGHSPWVTPCCTGDEQAGAVVFGRLVKNIVELVCMVIDENECEELYEDFDVELVEADAVLMRTWYPVRGSVRSCRTLWLFLRLANFWRCCCGVRGRSCSVNLGLRIFRGMGLGHSTQVRKTEFLIKCSSR